MDVGNLCTREVLIVERDESVLLAAELMRLHNTGDVIVVADAPAGRVPVGILTDRDVALGVVAARRDPATTKVGELLGTELVTATEDEELVEVLARMRARGIRRVVVVGGAGELQGILAVDDVIDLLAQMLRDIAALVGRQSPSMEPGLPGEIGERPQGQRETGAQAEGGEVSAGASR